MKNKVFYYRNPCLDPHQTLAVEEYMLAHITPGEIILYLYTHEDSVIIGKNQNVWAECRHEKLFSDGGKLARRISGGGAVFHDLENLNFSFIAAHDVYNLHRQLQVMLEAANSFGIKAEFSGRNDILTEGRKFSGNAFCHRKNGAFHHGTILINTDMTKLSKYLAVSKDKIESKGISSVRSRVVNLAELNPDIMPDSMEKALKTAYEKEYGHFEPYPFTSEAQAEIERLTKRNESWEWLFGQTPQFDITTKTRFPWGGIELMLNLRDAVVMDARIFSDAMDADFIGTIAPALIGCEFKSDELARRVLQIPHNESQNEMVESFAEYLARQQY
ncbi:MAG: lipoate--protein ligase [Christensenella sp.]|nr:lipoate--protein ligase [Christensenella sp.]